MQKMKDETKKPRDLDDDESGSHGERVRPVSKEADVT